MTDRKASKEVIDAAITFSGICIDHYGSEVGNDLVSQIFDILEPGLKNKVLMELLRTGGKRCPRLVLDVQAPTRNKIGAIRAVRIVTGLGLKESKEAVESAESSSWIFPEPLDHVTRERLREALQNTGYKIL